MHRHVPLSCVLLLGLGACDSAPKGNPEGAPPRRQTVDPDNPDACAQCHAQIVAEWKESIHARAHHERDPIYGGVRSLVKERLGAETAKRCATCHNPRDPENPASPAGALGVSCATCHMLDDVHEGRSGADALVFASVVRMRAGHDMAVGSSPAHATGKAPEFIKDRKTVCLACHDAASNPGGVSTCATGAEFDQRAATDKGCIDCHMPRIAGPGGDVGSRSEHARHVFLGPHRAWTHDDVAFVADHIGLEASFAENELVVSLHNQTGHAFPTGFPGRVAMLELEAKNASGELVWRNIDADPMADDPDAVFNKIYVDEAGAPTMPVFGVSVKRDNRLKPAETRTLSFEVPEAASEVEVSLIMRLVPPAVHGALGIAGTIDAEPRTMKSVTVRR